MKHIKSIFKSVKKTTSKNAPEILIGFGIAGLFISGITAVKATPKVLRLIEEAEKEKNDKLTKKEIVKVTYKQYIPAIVQFLVSSSLIIYANTVKNKRTAAVATAYKLAEGAYNEYKDKVIETFGEEKHKEIKEKLAKDKAEKTGTNSVIVIGDSETLCYDPVTGKEFVSDIETIKKACNEISYKMLSEDYASLNDFYDELGLDNIALGDDLGWNIGRDGLLDISFSSQLNSRGKPVLVLDYLIQPRYEYDKLY